MKADTVASRETGPAPGTGRTKDAKPGLMSGPVGRNLGLVIALAILCAVGIVTAGDRFLALDNALTQDPLVSTGDHDGQAALLITADREPSR